VTNPRDDFRVLPMTREASATKHYVITPGAGDLPNMPRAIRADAAALCVLEDEEGVQVTYNLAAGEVIPFRAAKVISSTGTLIAWV
jgi:hypothetical protein